jgi:hypothetical protein
MGLSRREKPLVPRDFIFPADFLGDGLKLGSLLLQGHSLKRLDITIEGTRTQGRFHSVDKLPPRSSGSDLCRVGDTAAMLVP